MPEAEILEATTETTDLVFRFLNQEPSLEAAQFDQS